MSDETKVPALPSVAGVSDANTRAFLMAVKELLEVRDGRRGQKEDRFVTLRELAVAGVAEVGRVGSNGKAELLSGAGGLDYATPPALANLAAVGGYAQIFLEWDAPLYDSFSHVEVWRSASDNLGTAQYIGETPASVYSDACGTDASFFYWVRAVSKANVRGPYNAVDGVGASTSDDIDYLIEQLTGSGTYQPFFAVNERYLLPDGVTWVEAGLYVKDARIANGTIKNAMMGTASIDDAKVANLSAAKVMFGEMHGDRIATNTLSATAIDTDTIQASIGDIITLNAQQITTGELAASTSITAGQGAVVITGAGKIRSVDVTEPDPAKRRYTEMTSGNVVSYDYFSGVGLQEARALTNLYTGTAENSATVYQNIPGYWKEPPNVIVSLNSLQVYSAGASAVNQKIVCTASNIERRSIDPNDPLYHQFRFLPTAYITVDGSAGDLPIKGQEVLAAAYGSYEINPAGTFLSSSFTMPANVTSGVLSLSYLAKLVNDLKSADSDADGWVFPIVVEILVGGVAQWSTTFSSGSLTQQTGAFAFPAIAPGLAAVRVSIVNAPTKPWNNSTYAWNNRFTSNRFLQLNSVSVVSSAASYLAGGTLTWIALGR